MSLTLKKTIDWIIHPIILMLLLLLRDVFLVGIPDFMIVGVITLSLIILPFENLCKYIFFIFPITTGIPGYTMLAAYIVFLIKGPELRMAQIYPLIGLAVIEMFNEVIPHFTESYMGFFSYISFTAVFFYFLNIRYRKIDIIECIYSFALGVSFTLLVIYTNMISEYGLDELLSGTLRSGMMGVEGNDSTISQGHIAMNANTIAYFCICSISSLASVYFYTKRNLKFTILLTSILIVGGIFSFSRTYIVSMAILIIMILISQKMNDSLKLVLLLFMVVGIAMIIFPSFFEGVFNVFESRSEEENIETAGGRTIIFERYNEKWLSDSLYILIGGGVITYRTFMGVHKAMHCGLQQIWVCTGILGFIIYFANIFNFIKKYYKKDSFILLIPFIVTFLFDQSVQSINPYPLILPILASLYVLKIPRVYI